MGFLDRYQLRIPLGEGELGTTWSGEDRELGRPVVIAIADEDAPETVRTELLRRGELLSGVDHPALVRALGAGTTEEGSPYLVTEMLEGRSLAERLADGPPIGIELLVDLASALLEGLAAAHEAGVFHGDIEAGNVFLVGAKTDPNIKLIGLGLNRMWLRGGPPMGEVAPEPSTLRSLGCMSPEQARREVVADLASDIYSVGAVLYDAVTGAPPHFLADPQSLRDAVANGRPAPMHRRRRELAGAIGGSIDRAISPPPGRRFPDALSMRRALRSALIVSPRARGLTVFVGPRVAPETRDPEDDLEDAREEAAGGLADLLNKAAAASVTPWGEEGTAVTAVPLEDTEEAAEPDAPGAPDRTEAAATPEALDDLPDEPAGDGGAEPASSPDETPIATGEAPIAAGEAPNAAGEAPAVGAEEPEDTIEAAPGAPPEPSEEDSPPALVLDGEAAPEAAGAVRPAGSKGLPRSVWIGAGVGAAALVGVLVALSAGDTDGDATGTAEPQGAGGEPAGHDEPADDEGLEPVDLADDDATVQDDDPGELGEDEDEEPADPGAGQGPDAVRITLVGLPEGARVVVGGDAVDGPSFELSRGTAPVSVRIDAPGFVRLRTEVTPEADQEMRVRMRRRGGGRPAALTDPGF